jgi:uncharacterized protein YndB with AHSA1/START domain
VIERPGAERSDETNDRELHITRVFDAPRALVFQAFVDPERVLRWAGPRDLPAVETSGDVRPGGAWRTCLRSLDGRSERWQGGTYLEVIPDERLVYTFAWDLEGGGKGPETVVTITFEDRDAGKKTLVTFRQRAFDTPSNRDGHRLGWNSGFDRLAELLEKKEGG